MSLRSFAVPIPLVVLTLLGVVLLVLGIAITRLDSECAFDPNGLVQLGIGVLAGSVAAYYLRQHEGQEVAAATALLEQLRRVDSAAGWASECYERQADAPGLVSHAQDVTRAFRRLGMEVSTLVELAEECGRAGPIVEGVKARYFRYKGVATRTPFRDSMISRVQAEHARFHREVVLGTLRVHSSRR